MRQEDVGAVFELESQVITPSWSASQISSELDVTGSLHFVAEQENALFGYTFFRTCGNEAELLRIGVDPTKRRTGIGRTLMAFGLTALVEKKIELCFLEVRRSNKDAQFFYQSLGFCCCGVRPKYYSTPAEDAVLMRRDLMW